MFESPYPGKTPARSRLPKVALLSDSSISHGNSAGVPHAGIAPTPLVDVTIPVHTPLRPIHRAVSSVLEGTDASVRVTVVAHNVDPTSITANLAELSDHPSVRVVSLEDGVFSPAGPLNHGLDLSTAPWVSVMGSDDELELGAIDSWLALAAEASADIVIPVMRRDNGRAVADPPVRHSRRKNLDPVLDRLAYRSSPLGLISQQALGSLRFSAGLASGEDLAFTTHLWFSGARIAFDRKGPSYRIHDDAEDRVSFVPKTIEEDFAFLEFVDEDCWVLAQGTSQRRALAVKLMRAHLIDAIVNRSHMVPWPISDRDAFASIVARVERWSPTARSFLSIADRRLIEAVLASHASADEIKRLVEARSRFGHPLTLLTQNPLYAFHQQGPFRTLLAGYAVQRD